MTHLSPISLEISKQKTLDATKDQRLLSSGALNKVKKKKKKKRTNNSPLECVFFIHFSGFGIKYS